MAKQRNNKKIVNTFEKGIHMDMSPENQPKGTYRYALNAVTETEEGDLFNISTEESNKLALNFPGKIILGKVYMTNNEVAILSTNEEETLSYIGVFNLETNTYKNYVEYDLGFTKDNQFDIVYRMRRGCERTIYFTDNNIKPMRFNFDKIDNFKVGSEFSRDKFLLQKSYRDVPFFRRFEVIEGGRLRPGGYIFGVQYLDEDLNPTDIANVSNRIKIYEPKLSSNYSDITGTSSIETQYSQVKETSKAISIDLFNLDKNYAFYRLAIVKLNNGSGRISEVTYTDKISTSTTNIIYDGTDYQKGSLIEVQQDNFIFHKIKNLVQLEDQLIASNVSGNPDNLCKYQRFASKIKSRVVLKKQVLSKLNIGNNKHPSTDLLSVGYMPGEIYSFGIVYLFKDGTRSPAYHIPGIPKYGIDRTLVLSDPATQPYRNMSTNNELSTTYYDSRDTCANFWGTDAWGNDLEGKRVRHHRFPTREEAKAGFVFTTKDDTIEDPQPVAHFLDVRYRAIGLDTEDNHGSCELPYKVELRYKVDGEQKVESYDMMTLACTFHEDVTYNLGYSPNITDIEVNVIEDLPPPHKISIQYGSVRTDEKASASFNTDVQAAYIYGIEFSNIEVPNIEGHNEVIGYEIVRQDRDAKNRTVIDTAILTPIINNQRFSSSGQIFPEFNPPEKTNSGNTTWLTDAILKLHYDSFKRAMGNNPSARINQTFRGLVSPQFLFTGEEAYSIKLVHVGNYKKSSVVHHSKITNDVQPGTSYDPDANKKKEKDLDGYSLNTLSRIHSVNYESLTSKVYDPKELFYLDAVSSFVSEANDREIFNVSSDNKTGIVEFNENSKLPVDIGKLPYVILTKDLKNPYSDFLTAKFHKQQLNPTLFSSSGSGSISLYGGDSFISPMTYTNTYFIDVRPRKRKNKSGLFRIIAGALLVIASVVATVVTAGAALPLTQMSVQYGMSLVTSGIKQEKLSRAYGDLWDKGLKETVLDYDVFTKFTMPNPEDDEIQWMNDIVQDLWFESNVNFNLRLDAKDYGVKYIQPLRPITGEYITKYTLEKLTVADTNQGDGRLYKGFATAEYYEVNKDYDGTNEAKMYYQIPYEYSCCTACREFFPTRVHSSQKSFSEELTDNFAKFLPNDYKDISGETGHITNMFVQNNRLYLHTSEALWMQPATYQERVTNEIVSFVGTGSLFETPEQKIVDDSTGNSVGLTHKWGAVNSKHGYFFPSTSQNKVYLFSGKLDDLSLKGLSSWFKANLKNTEDNPSNVNKGGILAAYDPQKERFLLTNRDKKLPWTLSYCVKSSSWRSFHSYNPNMYITGPNKLYTWNAKKSSIWQHNIVGTYQRFYEETFPHELEYISVENPMMSKVTNTLGLFTTAKKYYPKAFSYRDVDNISYSKVMVYNSKQNSGLLTIQYQDNEAFNFFKQSVTNTDKTKIRIGRVDKDWSLNGFRDVVVDYSKPMFVAGHNSLEINKILNSGIINYNKNWSTLQSFKDKYLAVKYVFNNFEDIKLTTRYTTEDFEVSLR